MSEYPAEGAITLPGEPAVTLERDVPCQVRDGTILRADVYRPAEGSPWPVILMRLPYDKRQAETIAYAHPSWYARHGYLVVVQDIRGCWASDGEWEPFHHEAEDGYDAIEWAARLPGANGRVGMYGFSYAGATQLLPATLRPPSLVTICPGMTASRYDEGWTYQGGALSLAFVASWATGLAADQARRAADGANHAALSATFNGAPSWYGSLPLTDYPPLAGGHAPYFFDWLANPPGSPYWERWSIERDYARITTPALHVAGWYDVFLAGVVRNFVGLTQGARSEEARLGQRLVIGPWYHIPWDNISGTAGESASAGLVDDLQLSWFDQFLKEEDGALDAPVSLWLLGEGRWHDFSEWPPTGSIPTPFFLHSGGRANSSAGDGVLSPEPPEVEPPDVFVYDPVAPNPSAGGHSCCFPFIAPMGPADQAPSERWNGVLVYTGDPLDDDLDLIGDVSATLFAASTALDTDWTVRLCDVDPDGRSINLQEGIIRARYRDGFAAPTPIDSNLVYRYEIALGPVGARITAGHRLRLTVSSSDFPQWDRNLNTGGPLFQEPAIAAVVATQTVLHDADHPSSVTLPIYRG